MEHLALNLDNGRIFMQKRIIKTRNLKVKVESVWLIIQAILKAWQKLEQLKSHNKKHLCLVILYVKFKLNLV